MKIALVTGSSRGIGRAEAIQLAEDGYSVCINCIERVDLAKELAEEIISMGHQAITYQADVSDYDAVMEMIRFTKKEIGPITLLVNNAGIAEQHQIQDVDEALWDRMFDVNVKGAFNTIKAVLPDMLHEKKGCIINTSSVWGLHGASCESVYSSTKHAIVGLTRSLAAELAPSGIRVNCVAPGVINTDMVKVLGIDVLKDLANNTPLRRLGDSQDIAKTVSFLASESAAFITGQIITCDGGFVNL